MLELRWRETADGTQSVIRCANKHLALAAVLYRHLQPTVAEVVLWEVVGDASVATYTVTDTDVRRKEEDG